MLIEKEICVVLVLGLGDQNTKMSQGPHCPWEHCEPYIL
jgi:hypothetical protein